MKRGLKVFFVLSIFLILGLSFVSAGLFNNIFNKVTGKVTDTCTDSDGGNYTERAGTVFSLDSSVKGINDTCRLVSGSMSSPVKECSSAENCYLTEGYCLSNGNYGYTDVKCSNGCSNGACIKANQTTNATTSDTCTDSYGGACTKVDLKVNGQDLPIAVIYGSKLVVSWNSTSNIKHCYLSGNWIPLWGAKNNTDILGKFNPVSSSGAINLVASFAYDADLNQVTFLNNLTIGIMCTGDSVSSEDTVYVPVYLQETTWTCKDSDGGEDYSRKGNITINGEKVFDDYCFNDVLTGFELEEGVCYDGAWGELYYQCPNGCLDGACVSNSTFSSVYPSPFIVNGAADVAIIYGTQTGVSALELVQAGNIQDDLQSRTTGLGDSLIKDSNVASVNDKNLIVIGTPCSNSLIYESFGLENCNLVANTLGIGPGQFVIQSGSGSNGKIVLFVVGYDVSDVVNATRYLLSHEIKTSAGSKYIIGNTSKVCTDSDGGINYYVRGTVKGAAVNTMDKSITDYCAPTADNSIIEYFCNQSGAMDSSRYPCPNGCKDGACLLADTDCTVDADCPSWTSCIVGKCVTTSPSPLYCVKDSNCGINQECADGICQEAKIKVNITCSGCSLNNKCYPFGYRKSGLYCSDSYKFVEQTESEASCDNNFECASNVCANSQCVSGTLIQKILNWFSNIFS